MKLYKLTEQDGTTRNKTQWGEGVQHKLPIVKNPRLCSPDVLHAYKNINLALLLNPIHTAIKNPIIWEAKGRVVVEDNGKVGCFVLTTIKEVPPPEWYFEEHMVERARREFLRLVCDTLDIGYSNIYQGIWLLTQILDWAQHRKMVFDASELADKAVENICKTT